jgi:acyl-coenzyme A thioesterase PaaI-like protein
VDATELARRLLEPIPANNLMELRVIEARHGTAEVVIELASQVSNVIGTMHSSGLITLADAAGLAAIISTITGPDEFEGVVPLGAAADLQFKAPGRGRLVARCTLDESTIVTARSLFEGRTDRVHLRTSASIFDPAQALVCVGRFHWSLRRAGSARSSQPLKSPEPVKSSHPVNGEHVHG